MTGLSRYLWSCKGLLKRPSGRNAFAYATPFDTYSSSPFRNSERFAIESNKTGRSSIARVFRSGCPSAVFSTVVSVIIDAIDLMFVRRPWSHVFIKRLKRVKPIVTNFNASLAIPTVLMVIFVTAPAFHGSPHPVFGSGRHAVGLPALISFQETVFLFHKTPLTWMCYKKQVIKN